MAGEADKIYQEVEQKKQRAKELGIPKLFDELYLGKIKYYPNWMKNPNNRKHVCSLVSAAIQLDKETTQITSKDKDYVFAFKDSPSFGSTLYGTMTLNANGKRILALKMAFEGKEYPEPLGYWGGMEVL